MAVSHGLFTQYLTYLSRQPVLRRMFDQLASTFHCLIGAWIKQSNGSQTRGLVNPFPDVRQEALKTE